MVGNPTIRSSSPVTFSGTRGTWCKLRGQACDSQRLRALPWVEADSPRRPAGLLRHAAIMRTYTAAVDRRASRDRRLRPVRRSDNVRYLELRVSHESSLDGTLLSDLRLTEVAVIVAVRHEGATLIPRGQTRLAAGDRVTIIAAANAVAEVRATFEGRP